VPKTPKSGAGLERNHLPLSAEITCRFRPKSGAGLLRFLQSESGHVTANRSKPGGFVLRRVIDKKRQILYQTRFWYPLLHVSPSVRDAHLRWEDAEFSPHPTQGGDPFALTIKISATVMLSMLTISFVLTLNTDDLIMMAKNSGLFSSKHIEGDATQVKVPTRSGFLFNSATQIDFTEDNVVRRDEIAVNNEIIVAYPSGIRNAIYLWFLVTS
jgi:hypothetical protein